MDLLMAHELIIKPIVGETTSDKRRIKISLKELEELVNTTPDKIDYFTNYLVQSGFKKDASQIYTSHLIKILDEGSHAFKTSGKFLLSHSASNAIKNAYLNLRNSQSGQQKVELIKCLISKYDLEFPRLIQAETLAACNAKCTFCPYDTLDRKGEKMSWQMIEKFAYEFQEYPEDHDFSFAPYKVSDPFLDNRLCDIAELILSSHPLVRFALTTNGNYIPKNMIDRLIKTSEKYPGRISLSFSINTVDSTEYKNLMKLNLERTIKNLNIIQSRADEFISSGIKSIDVTRVSTDGPGDSKFSAFAQNYKESQYPSKPFLNFLLYNLNGWINHDVHDDFATKA